MNLWRAFGTLVMLSFRRLLWSASTLMVAFPLLGCALFLLRRRYTFGYEGAEFLDEQTAFGHFSEELVLLLFVSFIMPICALAYATTSIGGDREDRTLLFLLVRPIPRWLVVLAKLIATLPLVVGLVVGSFWIYCRLAGPVGQMAFELYLPAVFYMTVAYVSLFHLFAVSFRHSTIIALVYSLFMEILIGSMPGIVKRITVSFFGKSMIFEMGADHGLEPPNPQWFVPMTTQAAGVTLLVISGIGLLLTLIIFSRREYRDLT